MKKNKSKTDLTDKVIFLRGKIKQSIDYTDLKKRKNKQLSALIKIIILLFSGGATILLGLNIENFDKLSREIAFVLSSLIVLMTSIEPFFNFKELWLTNEAKKGQFLRIKDRLDFETKGKEADEINEDEINDIFRLYNETWDDLNTNWKRLRRSKESNSSDSFIILNK